MGRTRSFDEATVVAHAARQFRATGYEATSLDDLLSVTGLHRGSLYQAFGSKRGLFLAALAQAGEGSTDSLDLLLVALLELAPTDFQVREIAARLLGAEDRESIARRLGDRLVQRAQIDLDFETSHLKDER